MIININPYQNVGDFYFFKSRDENRKILSNYKDELYCYARTDGELPDDSYDKLGLTLIYNKYNKFSAIEIKSPSNPIFKEKEILKMNWDELITWFHKIDDELQLTEEGFVSYKYGIYVLAPKHNVNLNVFSTSVTVFSKDFFSTKIGLPNPKLTNSFQIQVAFIEPLPEEIIKVETIKEGMQKMLVNNREKGIILWNQIPISFDYNNDFPKITQPIINMIDYILSNKKGEKYISFNCDSFETNWNIKWNEKHILVDADWIRIKDNYHNVFVSNEINLNQLTLLKTDFLAEWKLLLKQIYIVLKHKNMVVPEKNKVLKLVNENFIKITFYGKFYKEDTNVLSLSKGRKLINLKNTNYSKQLILASILIAIIVFLVFYFNNDKAFFGRMLKYSGVTLLISFFITLGLAFILKRKYK